MDQARKKEVGQFDKHSEIRDFGDNRFESLAGVGSGLHFEIFEKFEFLRLLLRLGCGAFCARKVLREGIERSSLNAGSTFRVGEGTMDEEICVPTDGRGQVGVVGFCQTEVAETIGGVDGTIEGAKKTDLKGVAIGTTGKKL